MRYIPEGTELILWGTGFVGRRIMEGKYGNYRISFAINGKLDTGETYQIGNISVFPPDILKNKSYFKNQPIIIGVDKWQEIAARLEEMGKRIFRDYIPYTCLYSLDISRLKACENDDERRKKLKELSSGKKLCGLYGFCHMDVYKTLLSKNKQFTEEYCLLDLPRANDLSLPNSDLLQQPWVYSTLDLLILGFVYPTNGAPDWRTVKSLVNDKCKVILITNAAFKGYFPQHIKGRTETKEKTAWGEKNINRMILAGETPDTIFQTISMLDFYDVEKVNRFFENELNKLEQAEVACDVRIGDFIRKYARQKRLMYSSTHPNECVMKEISIRLFKQIGLDTGELEAMSESDILSLRANGEFIYPSVSHALGLDETPEFETIRVNHGVRGLTLAEYVDFYVEQNKPYITEESR